MAVNGDLEAYPGADESLDVVTFWDSIDAVRRFAGDDYELARYYPRDDEYLLERERNVVHYEVVPDSTTNGPSPTP